MFVVFLHVFPVSFPVKSANLTVHHNEDKELVYLPSLATGCPTCAKWTRIWCLPRDKSLCKVLMSSLRMLPPGAHVVTLQNPKLFVFPILSFDFESSCLKKSLPPSFTLHPKPKNKIGTKTRGLRPVSMITSLKLKVRRVRVFVASKHFNTFTLARGLRDDEVSRYTPGSTNIASWNIHHFPWYLLQETKISLPKGSSWKIIIPFP